jgi:hypothetical protein
MFAKVDRCRGGHSLTLLIAAVPCILAGILTLAANALAGPPQHLPLGAVLGGLNRPCGVAVDSEGSLYVANAGEDEIKIFDSGHTLVDTITESVNDPCGLAVDSGGHLYVSERGAHEVVRYRRTASGFAPREVIDPSGEAEGIAVDPHDDRLYVAEGDHVQTYSGVNEQQRASVGGLVTGGTYTLTFEGTVANPLPVPQTTAPISHSAGPVEVEAALVALPAIEPEDVEVRAVTGFFEVINEVTFTGAYEHKDIEPLEIDDSALVGGGGAILIVVDAWEGAIGNGALTDVTGVAAYTYGVSVTKSGNEVADEESDRYLFVADQSTDEIKVLVTRDPFGETLAKQLGTMKLRQTIAGPLPGEHFGFGAAGAYLSVDGGNADDSGQCISIKEQACTAGHVLVYDAAHGVIDEFEASGELLDQFSDPALEDAEPTALAIERSGGPNDGQIYVTSDAGADGSLLAFSPLAAPNRKPLQALSRPLPGAGAVATDCRGYVYVAAGGGRIHVYSPAGVEIVVGGLEDDNKPGSLAVDCAGNVYVVDKFGGAVGEPPVVTYYAPDTYPPVDGTSYARHEPPIAGLTSEGFGARASDVAVNPVNNHVFVLGRRFAALDPVGSDDSVIGEFRSASEGSGFVRLVAGTNGVPSPSSLDVRGVKSNIYVNREQVDRIFVTHDDEAEPPAEELARIVGRGCPSTVVGSGSKLAVNQSNGHVLAFSPKMAAGREYNASGACVTEFFFPEPQRFATTEPNFDIAIDNSCANHRNENGELEPLDETTTPTCEEFDPANGNAYISYDDPKPASPDLWAFGPLSYGVPPSAETGLASIVGSTDARLTGSIDPNEFAVEDCIFEWGTSTAYGELAPCSESDAEIGNGAGPVAVHADITGIDPPTTVYHFRLCAKNRFGDDCGDDGLFGPPMVSDPSALPVLYDEATLRAQIDPSGLATKYHFDYIDQQSFEEQGDFDGPATRHTAEGDLAAGAVPTEVNASVGGLAQGTTYHFRVVVENDAATMVAIGAEFRTLMRRDIAACPNDEYRTGASAALPDCRAYELVTPAETGGLRPFAAESNDVGAGFDNWLVLPRGEGAGETLTYFMRGTLAGFEGNGTFDAYRATRPSGEGQHPPAGWGSQLVGPTYAQAVPDLHHNIDVRGVSSDQLFSFWFLDPAMSLPESLATGIYLRTPSGFEPVGLGTSTDRAATSHYVSPGGRHVIFSSTAQLEPTAPPPGVQAIYDRAAGSNAAKALSAAPADASLAVKEKFMEEDASFLGATEDGTAVVFALAGALYMHHDGETAEIAPSYSEFNAISEDGEQVFYTAAGDILAFEAGATTLVAHSASFVLSAPDGSDVFFTSIEGGTRNLQAWDRTSSDLIAALSPSDPADLSPRTTPDGATLLFRSRAQLTPYDNEGRVEIYRYAAATAPSDSPLCVSCNPSGAPPSGDAALRSIPAQTALIPNITDDGTWVLFESPDQLLPEDANDVIDVYEWTAKGTPRCDQAGGCLALISSGQGESDNQLYGMSADGRDVIFFTLEKLVGRDVSGSPSLYDAREGGGIPEEPAPEICSGDACQGVGSAPPTLPQPVSAGSGGGNVEQTRKRRRRRCARGKRMVHRHGKAVCVKKRGRRQAGRGEGRGR